MEALEPTKKELASDTPQRRTTVQDRVVSDETHKTWLCFNTATEGAGSGGRQTWVQTLTPVLLWLWMFGLCDGWGIRKWLAPDLFFCN